VAVASAVPHANNLHLTPDRYPRQHLITQFLQARCSSRCADNSVKELKGKWENLSYQNCFRYGLPDGRCRI